MPGGGLEPNEDSSAAAVREVMEEAGVIGKLARCLGSFEVTIRNVDVVGPVKSLIFHTLTTKMSNNLTSTNNSIPKGDIELLSMS